MEVRFFAHYFFQNQKRLPSEDIFSDIFVNIHYFSLGKMFKCDTV